MGNIHGRRGHRRGLVLALLLPMLALLASCNGGQQAEVDAAMATVTAEIRQTEEMQARTTGTAQAQAAASAEAVAQAGGTATAEAQAQATETAAAQRTGTAVAQATATGAAQETATAMAEAAAATRDAQVEEANRSATATARWREIYQYPMETATAGAVQTRQSYVSTAEAGSRLVFGPRDGNMVHDEGNWIKFYYCGILATNLVAEITYVNPYAAADGAWDYGLLFRFGPGGHFGLSFFSDEGWVFFEVVGEDFEVIAEGSVDDFNVGAGEANYIKVIADGEDGLLYVNEALVSRLDLSSRTVSGDVIAVSGYWVGSEIAGEVTQYQDFTVYVLQ